MTNNELENLKNQNLIVYRKCFENVFKLKGFDYKLNRWFI